MQKFYIHGAVAEHCVVVLLYSIQAVADRATWGVGIE